MNNLKDIKLILNNVKTSKIRGELFKCYGQLVQTGKNLDL